MTILPLTDVEDVEPTLIARDVNDLFRAMLGPKGHPDVRSLTFPRGKFVIGAHYGLRGAAQTAIGAEDPFGAAIQSLTYVEASQMC